MGLQDAFWPYNLSNFPRSFFLFPWFPSPNFLALDSASLSINPAKSPGTANNSYRKAELSRGVFANVSTEKRLKGDQAVSISVASKITAVEVHTLRYWEREFEAFLDPERTDGGQRRYRPEDIQTVFIIKRLLRDEMFSIAGARRHLAKAREMNHAA